MDEATQKVLSDVQAKIQVHLDEILKLKKTANSLADLVGEAPIYADLEQEVTGAVGPTRPDAYYGKPLATAVREYLEFRRKAVPAENILKGLEQGGFDFEALGWSPTTRLRALAMSMAKNTAVFHRLPNNTWGLLAWYPAATERRTEKAAGGDKKSAKTSRKHKGSKKRKGSSSEGAVRQKAGHVESPAHKVVYKILADGELHSRASVLAVGKEAGVMPIAIHGILKNAKDIEAVGDQVRLKKANQSEDEE